MERELCTHSIENRLHGFMLNSCQGKDAGVLFWPNYSIHQHAVELEVIYLDGVKLLAAWGKYVLNSLHGEDLVHSLFGRITDAIEERCASVVSLNSVKSAHSTFSHDDWVCLLLVGLPFSALKIPAGSLPDDLPFSAMCSPFSQGSSFHKTPGHQVMLPCTSWGVFVRNI